MRVQTQVHLKWKNFNFYQSKKKNIFNKNTFNFLNNVILPASWTEIFLIFVELRHRYHKPILLNSPVNSSIV